MIAITTAAGPNVLGLRSFTVQEQLSRLFQIEAELSSEDGGIDFDKVVGNPASIRLNVGQKDKRYFNGFVSRLVQVANQGDFAHYRATIVPWLWFLTRTSDCRIFQQKKVPDIIEAVFKGHSFKDYQLKLSGSYQPKEYCVQYRETDFNFISRLMEQEGIYYYFDHTSDGKSTLVLADSTSAHKPFPNYDEVVFQELAKGTSDRESITDWTIEKEAQPVASALNDFDFTKPKTSLLSKYNVTRKYGKAEFEMYDYPGEYVDHGEGVRLATVRLDELQTQYEVLHGQGSARGLAAGCTFKLKSHPRTDQNREYLITGVSLSADAGEFSTTGGGGGAEFFSCSFTCIDKTQQFRPARLTPKPMVQGPQTAKVVGPSGETIHTDNYGRVKVQFHWDRYAKGDDNSSCWIRSSQPWGGKGWGGMFIPHVGQEVVVEFLEGDPDRPLISGRIYNADQMPPLPLPANKTKSVIRDHGGNHIRMEGLAGSEQIHLFSPFGNTRISIGAPNCHPGVDIKTDQKMNVDVAQTSSTTVGGDEDHTVMGTMKEHFKGPKHWEWTWGFMDEAFFGEKGEMNVGALIEIRLINKTEIIKGWLLEVIHGQKIEYRNKGIKLLGKAHDIEKREHLEELIDTAKHYIKKKKEEIEEFNQAAKTAKLESENYQLAADAFKGSGKNYDLEYSQTMAVKANIYKEQAENIEAKASDTFKVLGSIIELG